MQKINEHEDKTITSAQNIPTTSRNFLLFLCAFKVIIFKIKSIILTFLKMYIFCLKSRLYRERETERVFICCFSLQMAATAGAELILNQEPEVFPWSVT